MLETYLTIKLISALAGLALGVVFTIWTIIREVRK